jgi:hypothetical protein
MTDVSLVESFDNSFFSATSIVNVEISNIQKAVVFSNSNFINHASLLNILNALCDLTGQTSLTCTLGSTNLARLTDTEKAIATGKNWTLA